MTWPEVALGDIAVSVQDGPFGSNLKTEHYADQGVRVIRLQNIGSGCLDDSDTAYVSEEHFAKLSKYECLPGDVLIATLGDPQLRACVQPKSLPRALNKADCLRLRCDRSKADPDYVSQYLNSPRAQNSVHSMAHGQTRVRVNLSQVRNLPMPLPPIEEQRRIAAVLDQAEALRAKRRGSLSLVASLTDSAFLDMFGDPSTNPRNFPSSALGHICATTSGGTPDRTRREFFGGDIPWIKSGELERASDGRTEERLTADGLRSSAAKLMPPGTVLMAMYGATAGELAVLEVAASTNQAVCCITAGEQLDSVYLVACLRALVPSVLWKRVGGAQANLSQGLIRAVVVPVPPIDLQAQFRERVAQAADTIFAIDRHRAELEALFASLQHRAFSGAL